MALENRPSPPSPLLKGIKTTKCGNSNQGSMEIRAYPFLLCAVMKYDKWFMSCIHFTMEGNLLDCKCTDVPFCNWITQNNEFPILFGLAVCLCSPLFCRLQEINRAIHYASPFDYTWAIIFARHITHELFEQ